jgi:hypothetical protein
MKTTIKILLFLVFLSNFFFVIIDTRLREKKSASLIQDNGNDNMSIEDVRQLAWKNARKHPGVTPLTVLEQIFTFDACPDSQGYNCYMMAYGRYDELESRMKKLRRRVEEEKPSNTRDFESLFLLINK